MYKRQPTDWSQNITSKLPQDIVDSLLDISKQMYDQRIEEFGDDTMQLINRLVCFKVIDSAWLQHLETMDHLRDGIGLRGYGQRDPLVEYKSEAFRLFTQLQNGINSEIATTIFKVQIQPQSVVEAPTTEITEGAKRATSQVTEAEVAKTKRSSSSRSNSKVEATRSVKLDPMRRSKKSKRKKKKRR